MSQQINLYEERLRPRRELATGRNLGLGVLAILVVMTALVFWTRLEAERKVEVASASRKQLADEQEKLTALTQILGKRKISPALAAEVDSVKAILANRTEVMAVLDSGKLGKTTGFSGFMSGFARQAQSDLWLTGFLIASGGDEIEIRGRLLDPSSLPGYVQRLSREPIFQGRRFAALEMRGVDPDVQKTGTPLGSAVANGGVGAQATVVPGLPRFIEFVLRSESTGALEAGARGESKP